MKKVFLTFIGLTSGLFALLFGIYFFNLDMKLAVNVIAPLLEKWYDKRDRKQYL